LDHLKSIFWEEKVFNSSKHLDAAEAAGQVLGVFSSKIADLEFRTNGHVSELQRQINDIRLEIKKLSNARTEELENKAVKELVEEISSIFTMPNGYFEQYGKRDIERKIREFSSRPKGAN
jgi:hypothetical protein